MGTAITDEQLRAFARDGYIVVPGAVERDRIQGALQSANHKIGERYEACEPDRWKEFTSDAVFLELFTDTAVTDYATQLVGQSVELLGTPQLALRFPVGPGDTPKKAGAHLDGITADSDELYSFTVLAGVLLNDTTEPNNGQTVVWPGTHHQVADWFRANKGTVSNAAEAGQAMGVVAWKAGNPTPVCGKAGDLLLSHYLLLHGAGPNAGPHIRYEVFYRLRAPDHLAHQAQACSDAFFEFEPVRRVLNPGDRTT